MNKNNGVRLLVVDDEPEILALMRDMLDAELYDVHIARSGEKALELLRKTECDVLLTDIRMVGMDGMELIERAGELYPDLQRMIMTGHGDIDTAIAAIKVGAINYFLKPIDIEEVLHAIDRSMENKKTQEELKNTQRQLLHAEKLTAIGHFSASISHVFNNSLCGVMNVLHGIRKCNSLPESDHQLTTMALEECGRMYAFMNNLQQFYRPSSGVWSQIDINRTIDEVRLIVEKAFKRGNVSIRRDFAPDIPKILTVPDQIKQVVLNVLENALDSLTEKRERTITVSTCLQNDMVNIDIIDTGVGIQKNDLGHIFEPFFTTKATKGAGLGLSVSYGIIKSHGGEILVESELGNGSTVHISLPTQRSGLDGKENTGS